MNAKKYLTLGIILSSSLLLSFNNDKRAQAQESALEKTGENASNRRRISTSTTINDDGSTTTYYQTSDESQVPEAVKNNPNDYNYSEKILPGETKTTADPGEIPAGSAVTEEIIEGETHYTTDHDEAKKHGNVQNVGETDADANTPNAVEVNDGAVRSGKKPDNAQGIQLPDKEVPSLSEDHLSKEEYEKKKAELEEAGYIIIDTTPSETPSYGEWSEPIDGTAPQDQLDNHTAEQLPDKVEHLTSPTPIQAGTTGAVTISNVQIRYVPADTSKSATHLGAWSEVPEGADSIAEKLAELLLTGENESQVRAQLKADGFSDESIDLIIKSAVSITVETVSTATDTEIKNAVSTALADANISLSAENLALIIGMVKTEAEKALNNTGQTIVAYILPDGTKGEVSLGDVKETEPDFLTKLEEALKDKGLTAEEITSILTPVKSFTKGSDLKITSDDLAGYGTFATLAEMQTAISDYLTAHHSYTQKEIESFLQTFSAEIKAGFNAQSQSGGTFEPGSVTTEADKAIASFLQNYAAGTLENASEIYNSKNSLLDSLLKAATEFHVFTREFNAGTQHIDGNVATENLESLSNHIGMNFLTNNTVPGVTDLFYFQNVNANGDVQIVNGGDVIVGSNSSVSGSTVNGVTFSHLKG